MKNLLLLLLSFLLAAAPAAGQRRVRVACVGNSVTYGVGVKDRATEAYPAQLQRMLGDGYEVGSFGHSGTTLLRHGSNPYTRTEEYRAALDFRADIVVIHLGLNDTDPRNWPQYADEFIPDYRALVADFRRANPKARVWLCLMTPIFHGHRRFDSGTRDWHALIQRRIAQVARTDSTGLIDLYTPLHCHPDLFPDALHPNAEGAAILARTVCAALTGRYGGLRLPQPYGDGMVLQRGQTIRLHGTADAGTPVRVRFDDLERTDTAGADGRWQVDFPARPAGGPYEIDFAAGKERRTLRDVWVGEVWLCSGQSNMAFPLRSAATAAADLAAADTLGRVHLYLMAPVAETDAAPWPDSVLTAVNDLRYLRPGRWARADARAAADFSAVGFHFARLLADSLGCHVGVISNAVGGSPAEAWIDRSTLELRLPAILRDWMHGDYVQEWARQRAALNVKNAAAAGQRHPYEPAYLFEAGIAPLERYALRGVVWYQGESNAHNVELHERLFPMLERSWRAWWAAPEMPFYVAQLSSLSTRPSWPHFRDSQRRLCGRLRQTWMAVTSDLGDSLDVHPRRKREVGERLALSALRHTYGRTSVIPSGPLYENFRREDGALRLFFRWGEGMRPAAPGDALRGFEVAGQDGLYHAASARVDGRTVVVESPEVREPCAVRYGWRPFTRANLVNAAGLPASTFRDERF